MVTTLIIGLVLNILSGVYAMWSIWDGGDNITTDIVLLTGIVSLMPFATFICVALQFVSFDGILIKGKQK